MNASQSAIVYGVFMNVLGVGTLLVGESGIGKSDLALAMLDRGHAFIADDIVEFSLAKGPVLVGRPPKLLRNFLNIRGLGVIHVPTQFGAEAVLSEQTLSMVVRLEKSTSLSNQVTLDCSTWSLLGVKVPSFSLPLSTIMRPREVLLETLVRIHQQMQKGNDVGMHFVEKHYKMLSESL